MELNSLIINLSKNFQLRNEFIINGLSKIDGKSILEYNYEFCIKNKISFYIVANNLESKLIKYCTKIPNNVFHKSIKDIFKKNKLENYLVISDNVLLKQQLLDFFNKNAFLENINIHFYENNKKKKNDIYLYVENNNFKSKKKLNRILNYSKYIFEILSLDDIYNFQKHFSIPLTLTPGPLNIRKILINEIEKYSIHHRSEKAPKIYKELSDNIKYLFGSKKGFPIAMLSTGLGAIESCFLNLTEPNDEVLILSNGFFGENLIKNANHYRLKIEIIKKEMGESFDLSEIEKKLVNKKFLFMTHLETSSGVINDISLISVLCKKYNVGLIVDAISSLANHIIKFDEWNLLAAIGTSTKGLETVPGISMICLSEKAIEISQKNRNFKPIILDWKTYRMRHISNGLAPSTFPIGLVASINKSVEIIKENGGIKKQFLFKKNLSNFLYNELLKIGFIQLSSKKSWSSWIVVVKTPINISAKSIRSYLNVNFNVLIELGINDDTDRILRIGIPIGICKKDLIALVKHIKFFINLS